MENRRQAIVDLVNQLGEVNIRDLKNLFPKVSEVTLRKDLRCLDEDKKLVRIHGGAKSIQDIAGYGSNFAMRKSLQQEEKSLEETAREAAAAAMTYGEAASISWAVWNGKIVEQGALAANGGAAVTDGVYCIGSVSKMYTTAAVMRRCGRVKNEEGTKMENGQIIELPEMSAEELEKLEVPDNNLFLIPDNETKTISVTAYKLTKKTAKVLATVILHQIQEWEVSER